jgi:hypothetical protein
MMLTYYDVEKLARIVYTQKLLSSQEKRNLERCKVRRCEATRESVPCRVGASGAPAK